jgi:peptidoglycan/LPS O-acetylase OafA/YrhL
MTGGPASGHRADIQALRALAVGSVVLYHLWPRILPGGFVGVDVFFVISGFLITGNLIREAERTGTIRVLDFWARRVRRLLPAALTVLAVTAVAVFALVPGNLWAQFFRETAGAALYAENWVLAADSVDYLAANNAPSPVQQFWTLSVEEQFYVVTPILILIVLALVRARARRRPALIATIGAVTAASFACSLWLTWASAASAYYVTTTRAWEFGIGALLVFVPLPRSVRAGRVALVVGLVAIAASARILSNGVPFPGATAAWPVMASAAAIWGGSAIGSSWTRILAVRPVQFVGDVSYAIYLWHWPLIVLAPYALGHALTTPARVAILGATVILAAASTRWIENPIRFAGRRAGRPLAVGRTMALGASGMAIVVALAATGLTVADGRRADAERATAAVVETHGSCLGANAIVHAAACRGSIAADVIVPDPEAAGTDRFNLPECWATVDSPDLNVCSFGPPDAPIRLAAIGDSHNNALLAAYRRMATERGWRIDVAGHNGCYWTSAIQTKPTRAMVDGCEAWKAKLTAWLDGQPPLRAILVTNARHGAAPAGPTASAIYDETVAGLVDAWSGQVRRGVRIVAIRDNPTMAADVVTCVARHRTEANETCALAESSAIGAGDPLLDAVARTPTATAVDLTDIYCPERRCLPIIGNVAVYQDRDHITATFSESLADALAERVADALGL